MFGKPSKRTQRRLEQSGRRAPAKILEIADRGMAVTSGNEAIVSNTEIVLKTTLLVEPAGEPSFEVTKRLSFPQLSVPGKGARLNVLFDPEDHEDLIIDRTARSLPAEDPDEFSDLLDLAHAAVEQGDRDAKDMVELLQSVGSETTPRQQTWGGGPDDRLRQLETLGELRESGVLTEDEFQAEKRKLLGSS